MRSDVVSARERELYETVWASVPNYGRFSPGAKYVPAFLEMSGIRERLGDPVLPAGTVLDAGCGSGEGALVLARQGFRVSLLDVTPEGLVDDHDLRALPFFERSLWQDLSDVPQHDAVYCCDVLEHIPTEFTMLVIRQLIGRARRFAFFSIALVPDEFGAFVGQPLHQTVQPFTWWRDRLAGFGTLVEARDLLHTGLYLVRCGE